MTIDTTQSSPRLAADIGGTFTDVVLEIDERRVTSKVLTTPQAPEQGVLTGIENVLKQAGMSHTDISLFIHGTTLATNALIEKKGAKTAFITTRGFRDTIEIGKESRFDQYDINLVKPEAIVPRELRLTVHERIAVNGEEVVPLELGDIKQIGSALRDQGVESVAIGLMHSYANPANENAIEAALRSELPDLYISKSSEICPEIREYERFVTTCANAYVQPIIASYLTRLREQLDSLGMACPMLLMTSGGGLTTLEAARRMPIRLVESGPAGGAILAAHIGRESANPDLLSFDMGGTTAKVCLIDDNQPMKSRSFEVARTKRFMKGSGMPVRIPVIEMVEIGAGGGSIASIDTTRRIQVGPESAASEPGPACYGRGGRRPTVTDADLTLGKIDARLFAGGSISLDPGKAAEAIASSISEQLGVDAATGALGICEIVEENMANAARVHAIERGRDITARAMIAFGGAAPLHAARLAEKLNVGKVIIPPSAGVGSAVGFLRAPISYEVVRSLMQKLSRFDAELVNGQFADMIAEATAIVCSAAPKSDLIIQRSAHVRYSGQGHEIEVDLPNRDLCTDDAKLIKRGFETRYRQLYGRVIPHADVEILSWTSTVTAAGPNEPHKIRIEVPPADAPMEKINTARLFDARLNTFVDAPIFWRFAMPANRTVSGPAIIAENETSTIVTSSFNAHVDTAGCIVLQVRETAGDNNA
ncbi:hydantoinase/oxoprolinase family protein [Nitratireductor sp. ZSWI3]|uniref:hydantoinase/oxoprolinase family protein n=1 Tax=Nitratireductor sp. ZSWI3 TaxID=2966359 RepID=UPI00214F968F|nr:hydantoinase/oxoprolinase family protein [Nitratireductor sp. ZSWI3]MCR4265820.1 hydantoinase/oxoprolinase family protein [Nitratireductor sp. ZSWI3]